MSSNRVKKKIERRAVIIGGVRTPFLRSFGGLIKMDAIALGAAAVRALLERYPVKWRDIDGLYWGGVVLPGASVNVGREIVLDLGLPPTMEAMTATRACTTSLLTNTLAAAAIERGEAEVMIAGGGDSVSNAEVKMPQSLVHKAAPVVMSKKSTPLDYLRLLGSLSLKKDLLPAQPAVRERSTGELMGESAEKMARLNGISREAQDAFALQSHQRAAEAVANGRFTGEIAPVDVPGGKRIFNDNIVRGDVTLEKLARLRPAFAAKGTLTAGNSSALTDGAAATILMNEEYARANGFTPLARFRSWAFDAVDPRDQLLLGPAFSMPRAVERAGMKMKDLDLVDIHEAFAAQVLSVLKMLGSREFGRQRLGLKDAFGTIDPGEINVHGGSIALGHPFSATGARMVNTMANELKLSGRESALLGICGAGGVSAGAVLEAVK